MTETSTKIIIDNGSAYSSIGIDDVYFKVPTALGRLKMGHYCELFNTITGEEIYSKRGLVNLSYPIKNSIIEDFNEMETIWSGLFHQELKMLPDDKSVLLTEPCYNPIKNREKTIQIMFESFDVGKCYLANQAAVSILSSGSVSGLVVESGEWLTHYVPVFDGYSIKNLTKKVNIGGYHLTRFLDIKLEERGIHLKTNAEREILLDIKHRCTWVSNNLAKDLNNPYGRTWENPSGGIIDTGKAGFLCPEILFNPNIIGKEYKGIHSDCLETIMSCDPELRKLMISCISLSGGNLLFEGLGERLKSELSYLLPDLLFSKKFNINPSQTNKAWYGAHILANLSSFDNQWITKKEYEEFGRSIVHRKCFM
jgi:actin-related protein